MKGFSFSQFTMPSSTSSPFSTSSSQQSQGFAFSNLSSSSPSPASSAPASSLFSSASQPQQTSSPFSFEPTSLFSSSPAPSTTSGFSFATSAFGSSLTANPSSTPSTVTTSNLFSGAQSSSAPNLFSGSQPSSDPKFSMSFSSAPSSSPAPSFGCSTSSSSAGSSLFGASFASSAPSLSTGSTALFPPSLFGASSSATAASTATTAPANPAPSLFGACSTAPSSAPASAPSSSGLFSSSSSSPFSASSSQAFPFGTASVFSKSNIPSASAAAPSLPATTSTSSSSSSSSSATSSFSFETPFSSLFQSSFGLKRSPSASASAVSTSTTTSATAAMPASLGFGASSAPSNPSTVTTTGALPPAAASTPSSSLSLFSSQAASSAASTPSVPVSGVITSLAANTSTSAAKSTSTSSAATAFPFSLSTKQAAPASASQPQSTTSAALFVLAIKDGMERMQLEKSALVEVGVQSDLSAHKVNQVASSEIVRSGPSEAKPCMESMQAENPDSEVEVQSAVPAATVNQVAGSEIVRAGPEGVPPLDKVVGQLETSARLVNVLAENRFTEDQPMDQSMVQSTPVDTVREFEAATSFQESELNRIFSNLFVCVEGFLVPRPYVELYKKILRRYGHMATTEVLTDCPLGLMGVATEVMRLFEEMASCTKTDLSEDLLRRWDFRLSSAESLKFKVDWLRQRLEEVKSSYRHQIENADAIEAVRSSLAVTESKLTAVIARRENHLKAKQAAEAIHKAAEAALAMVNSTLQQDDEEIFVFESEKLDQLVKLCAVEGDFMPGVTLASDLL